MNNVSLIKERVNCTWGNFSIVLATLNLIENILKNHSEGMCILVSGSDYPIKSNSFINSFLNDNSDKIFIDVMEAEKLWKDFYKRIEYYRVNLKSGETFLTKGVSKETFVRFIRKKINFKLFMKISFFRRKQKLITKFYGGSQWWAMNINDLTKVNNYIQINKKKLFSFFAYSDVPDEFFFHSIIMTINETDHQFKIYPSLTYVNWSKKNCTLPVTFDINDFDELIKQPSGKLFARKLDITIDQQIMDRIDKNIN